MKKVISIFLALVFLSLTFAGCSKEKATIEDCTWEMSVAMERENEKLIIAVGDKEQQTAYPDSQIVNVILRAVDGELIIEDITNGETYKGAYEEKFNSPESVDYNIFIEDERGDASVAQPQYDGGEGEPTLVISIGNYDLYFYKA